MKAIPGGVDRVVHVNAKVQAEYPKRLGSWPSSKPVKHYDCDLSGDATNSIARTSPFGEGKRHGLFGKKTQSRNQ